MKKEDLVSLLVYGLMIVIAVLVGLFVISGLFETYHHSSGNANMGYAFLFVIVSIIFNVLLFEFAHVVGAKVGGYKIMSFNVLGFCFYRKEDKWKFKFANFDGLTGETKIAPKKEKTSPRPFALAPLIAYALEIAAFLVIFFICSKQYALTPSVGVACILTIMSITIGGMLELYNIFPAHLDSTTDGYRLIILAKKENIEAYNELMRIEAAYAEKKELNDMKTFENITDFTSQVNLYSVYQHLKNDNYDAAEKLIDNIIANKDKISRDTRCSALAQKMYILLTKKTLDEAKKYYSDNLSQEDRRYISNDLSMQSIRAYLLISSMLDISEHEARFAISRVEKAQKKTAPGRLEIENKLYQIALNKVDEIRPEWHIKEKEIR